MYKSRNIDGWIRISGTLKSPWIPTDLFPYQNGEFKNKMLSEQDSSVKLQINSLPDKSIDQLV